MTHYQANADYEDRDSHPLRIAVGDCVQIGRKDQTWPGWIWVTDPHGNDGYMPEDLLEGDAGGMARVIGEFDPRVLTIRRGDRLESIRRIHGWHWCKNEAGEEGWVAGYLLRPASGA